MLVGFGLLVGAWWLVHSRFAGGLLCLIVCCDLICGFG